MPEHIGPRHKGYYLLPNLLTTASLFSGFLGLLWAVQGDYISCALAVLASCFFDGMDGKVARLTRSSSDFGVQLDSLVDMVSFGVTPAVLVYLWQTHVFGRIGLMACFLYMACGSLRLARFNIQSSRVPKKFFIGLPIPAGACTIATLVLFVMYLPETWQTSALPVVTLILMYLLSFLMISKVRYASFKETALVRSHPFTSSVAAIMVFVLVASEPRFLGFLFFLAYLISGPVYTYLYRPLRSASLLGSSSRQELS
ncbi:CDP-diacylglycerol--serine O-phosphatidyltransferase [Desulfohalobium retbaense]|uniref:CDP-diacylglycerol--serine O-phosphatidyltransferase n=1 Tax=Desulfohalobium retbaense (strain ATCC 49708 / DSM 5692 / JCM 16813 / HR100) TaxID=485915 RepID=C8X2V0_DESRD|nr:CDP-diacylglycerol--serine O-phosphatidyltransferase [Desulfohalobium retbaense]ACV68747.1 CDP-diacylglycerol/serineO-phosphatidyltransfera se [Desulfohalobium retbaense DSM 5692]